MSNGKEIMDRVLYEIKKAVVGKEEVAGKILMALTAGGHVLLDDIPGVGKTTLALSFSKALSLDYKRLQFTPDVTPSDITGFMMYNKKSGEFEYNTGAILCNLFLADEINRTSAKTQSALLEVMEEGRFTVEGETRQVPQPFIVIATQNPIGSIGTQQLPESQLDRFMICLSMGYPTPEELSVIMKQRRVDNPLDKINSILSKEDILNMRKEAAEIFVHDAIYDYVSALSTKSREFDMVSLGLSPRGSMALIRMTKARAYLSGRDFAIPDDVQNCFGDVAVHRLLLSTKAKVGGVTAAQIAKDILSQVEVPQISEELLMGEHVES
ncbi:MoxR family ATPase [Neobittarella massiliensis]|uniref:MoxR family ATPase n=1 Tax=Neobittarella massiliensis (ex Bilen et al. 2018) TaxID=2041842 RepID=A0A8J6IIU7_9FIRM|nr:MoxR family ATPase [Neobittarella massiliensis]MBC3515261.1 MoxR family ATPase [Neobittarella massiliensis]